MTPLPPINDPSCLRLNFTIADEAARAAGSRIYLSYSSDAPSGAELGTLAGVVATAFGSHLSPVVNTDANLATVTIRDMASDTGAEAATTPAIAGTRNGAFLPASACAVLNHKQNRHYRGGQCRTYLFCGVQADMSGTNQWSSAFVTAVTGAWEAFVAEILADVTAGITLEDDVLVSYYDGQGTREPPLYKPNPVKRDTPLVTNITGTSCAVKIGSQRRRLNL